ncbi:DUF2637 domain-containing protein [Streptantibioticus rubrisoli]|uniref:DUF2637 domain-containing protein n=1 Tax=Streptantibioticus rubrisoli TaxID=1387313 RepID=A0ABT1PCB0_9ACTN|nr:DUF2637 domain-containing protein [Streptantibioticus rubrisoli]MCQ4043007.1 DUF2637 domain-containing protein [Streptantibioticus rubrisoli]
MRRLPRLDAVLVQAVIAAALSFAHLHDIAEAAGQDGWKAWAYPISVDLLLVAAWRKLRAKTAPRLAWCWFTIALTASLGANVATAGFLDLHHAPAWLRMVVAGWPAAAFLGGTLLAHTTKTEPVPGPVEPAPEASPAEPPATEAELPALVSAEPDPAPAPALPASPVAAPAIPAALVAHARKIADTHRATTGHPIDPETLRARLGVPADLANAVAAAL